MRVARYGGACKINAGKEIITINIGNEVEKKLSTVLSKEEVMGWFALKFFSVSSRKELAFKFLRKLEGKPIIAQLRSQHIREICIRPLLSDAALIARNTGFLRIYLPNRDNGKNPLWELWVKGIGHELAHSFFYMQVAGRVMRKIEWRREEEDFCELFMQAWLAHQTNREELEELLGEGEAVLQDGHRWIFL